MAASRARLTPRGRYTLLAAGSMGLFGYAVGLQELVALAIALVVATVVCLGYVRSGPPDLQVSRRARPAVGGVGGQLWVEVTAANRTPGPAPAAVLRSRAELLAVAHGRAGPPTVARWLIPELGPGLSSSAAVPLPTSQRGVWSIGPLENVVGDPLGLFTRSRVAAPALHVVVGPRSVPLAPLPVAALRRSGGGPAGPAQPAPGADLRSLRDYQAGEDVRRVHWRTSARLGRLMVRQDEEPGLVQVALFVDLCGGRPGDLAVEECLEAAASVAHAVLVCEGTCLSLATSAGDVAGPGRGPALRAEVLEVLALAGGPGPAAGGPPRAEPAPGSDLLIVVAVSGAAGMALVPGRRPWAPVVVVAPGRRGLQAWPSAAAPLVQAGTSLPRSWATAMAQLAGAPARAAAGPGRGS